MARTGPLKVENKPAEQVVLEFFDTTCDLYRAEIDFKDGNSKREVKLSPKIWIDTEKKDHRWIPIGNVDCKENISNK